jgi:hypothetical protein
MEEVKMTTTSESEKAISTKTTTTVTTTKQVTPISIIITKTHTTTIEYISVPPTLFPSDIFNVIKSFAYHNKKTFNLLKKVRSQRKNLYFALQDIVVNEKYYNNIYENYCHWALWVDNEIDITKVKFQTVFCCYCGNIIHTNNIDNISIREICICV